MISGDVVAVLDGPNVTLLRKKVLEECEKEELIAAGSSRRSPISIADAVPGKVTGRNISESNYCYRERDPGQSLL